MKSTANFANINQRADTVSGDSAMGEVGSATDSYVYNGDILGFTVDGNATVDGESINQDEVAN